MRTTFRKAGVACGTAFASLAIALSTATGAGATSQAVIIGGVKAGTMSDMLMAPLLGGAFKDQQRVNVSWPAQAGPMTGKGDLTLGASIDIGITNLTAAIGTALGNLSRDADGNVLNGEKVTVVGLSAGSLVVDEVMRNMVASGQLVNPDEISFVLVEDSSRQELIKDATYDPRLDYTYHLPPETPYDVVVITGEYDGLSDLPDRFWNFLAVANAMAGAVVVHVPVMYYANLAELPDLPANFITVDTNSAGGTTTHYLVPTTTLPLVQLMPFLKPYEAQLKAKIDKGYKRYDAVPPTTTTAAAVTQAAETAAPETATTGTGDQAASTPAEPTGKTDAAAARAAAKEARTQAKADAAAARAAAKEARTQAKADAAAARAAAKEARAQAKADAAAARAAAKEAKKSKESASTGSSNKSGSSDSSGSSE